MTAAAPTTAAAIEKKIYGSGKIALIISNQEMEDTTVIVKYLEESGLLNKGVSKKKEKIENEWKEEIYGLFDTLVASLGTNLLANTIGEAIIRSY